MSRAALISGKTVLSLAVCALMGAGAGYLLKGWWPATGGALPSDSGRENQSARPAVPATGRRIQALLDFVRQAGSPDAQLAAALRMAAELETSADCQEFLEALGAFPGAGQGTLPELAEEMLATVALRRWLEEEPDAALEWCLRRRSGMAAEVLGSLALRDPDKARRTLARLPAGRILDGARREFAAALVRTDPDQAWSFLAQFPFPELLPALVARDVAGTRERLAEMAPALQAAAARAMVLEWMKTDPQSAWDWAGSWSEDRGLRRRMLEVSLRSDPERVCGFLRTMSVKDSCGLLGGISLSAADSDAAAAGLVRSLRSDSSLEGHVKEAMLAAACRGMSGEEQDSARNRELLDLWAELRTSNRLVHKARVLQKRAENALTAESSFSAEVPERMRPHELGFDPMEEQARMAWEFRKDFGWSRRGAGEREAPFEALPADSTESLLADLEAHRPLKEGDPRVGQLSAEAFQSLLESTKTAGSRAQTAVFEEMTRQKPETAAAWLRESAPLADQLGPPAARFAANWASADPVAAAKWVSALPAGDLAENAAGNVARQYHQYAPGAARAWAATLPAGPARDAAFQAMKE